MVRCVLFDLGYTLVYAEREGLYLDVLRRSGVETSLAEVHYALHRADQFFMARYPGVLGLPERQWLAPYIPVLLRELAGQEPEPALARTVVESALSAPVPPMIWRAYPDARPVIARLAELGVATGIVSNWDATARRVLDEVGLAHLVSPIVISSECGREKPDPDIFRVALEAAGVGPQEAVMVGDNAHDDVAGALAVGMRAFWLDRYLERDLERGDTLPAGAEAVDSLTELVAVLEAEVEPGAAIAQGGGVA